MKYDVLHETVYRYERPVVLSQQLLHLTPRVVDFQRLQAHRIDVQPAPAECGTREDYFGNPVMQFMLAAPHASLAVHAHSSIEVLPRAVYVEQAEFDRMAVFLYSDEEGTSGVALDDKIDRGSDG